ncbi:unnamed protein product [Chilo suppressalis]|uniref:Acyltransferase 3 domain-containing protein n=1 Tax=Chilo suppressalis TaxID=168631 RepID=A0ABN8LCI8_CHISP|nr:unnamed protein product [Chilo suppressalis]
MILLSKLVFQFIMMTIVHICVSANINNQNSALDHGLYEKVLDTQECIRQLDYITNNENFGLKGQFIDAGIRTPRGILLNNYRDMGNYFQCLDIKEVNQNMLVEGKYCVIEVPFPRNINIAEFEVIGLGFPWNNHHWVKDSNTRTNNKQTYQPLQQYELENANLEKLLVNGKLQSGAIFSTIGLLTIFSTCYDVRHSIILQNDSKKANKLYKTFSVFTNTRKFLTFRSDANALNCVEGVRALAMLWVILIHTFSLQFSFVPANPIDVHEFTYSFLSLFMTSGNITVDTFFMLTGLLLVYSQTSKMSRPAFLKNLHVFYLSRLLRMFPVLATGILLQASFQNHITDGPNWGVVAKSTDDCRQYWWTTLLYVHNLVSYGYLCLGHTWYLAVDMQLYVLSPIILVWVLGGTKKSALGALICSLLAVLASSTIYNFLMEFQTSTYALSRSPEDREFYTQYYYIHTFPRASPFFVGMIFGYLLHLCRGRKIRLSRILVIFYWLLATVTSLTIIVSTYFIIQPDWDNQNVDSLRNSFMRPAWAACVAWLIFACVHGYGGPINWFLSLTIFKFLGRLSYAMYIFHLPIIYIINATALAPIYFSIEFSMHMLIVVTTITTLVSFLVTVFIDIPFSIIFQMLLKGAKFGETALNKGSVTTDIGGIPQRIDNGLRP